MKRLHVLIVFASALVTWRSPAAEPLPFDVGRPRPRYQLLVRDNPTDLRFDLVLLSHDDRPICISYGGWPDNLGHVNWGSADVKVQSLQRSFPARNWDFGYCPNGECTIRIPPHGTLNGFVGYEEFGTPKEIAELPDKRLVFETTPHLCTVDKPSAHNDVSPVVAKLETKHAAAALPLLNNGNSQDEKTYRRIFESKLFVTRADCARISVRPLFKPESALSVYSRRSPKSPRQRSYYVTVTEASTSIHQSLLENNISAISVDQHTAKIPATAAVALKTLWRKMLSQANPNDAPADFINGEAIEFSLNKSPTLISMEELPSVAREQATTLQRLRNLLADYCKADWAERATLAREIRKSAKDLGNKL